MPLTAACQQVGAAFSGLPLGEDEAAAVRCLGEALAEPSGLPPAVAAAAHAELGEGLLARGRAAEAARCAGGMCLMVGLTVQDAEVTRRAGSLC